LDSDEGRRPASLSGRDSNQPVEPVLAVEALDHALALQPDDRALDPAFLALDDLDDLVLHPRALGPAAVHAQQHPGELPRLAAAEAGLNSQATAYSPLVA